MSSISALNLPQESVNCFGNDFLADICPVKIHNTLICRYTVGHDASEYSFL